MSETSTPTRKTVGLLRRAAEMERAAWRSLYVWLRRRPPVSDPGDAPFAYVGVIKPILGVFIVLSAVEIPIFDVVVTHVVPWRPARWIVLGLGVWGLLWMIGFLATMTVHPHIVGDRGIRVRHGAGVDITVPWDDVASVTKCYRSVPTNKSVQFEQDGERRVLNVAVGKQTSIDVRLRRPMTFELPNGPSEPVDEVRLYADDADGFPRGRRAAATA
jgi:hypothetical protein